MPPEPGQLIAQRYSLVRPLARGGMGEVWVARHVELDVELALKFSRFDDDFDSQGEQRFKREAQAAARLKSPHVVQIHDYGVHDGRPYIAMELLHGEDLGAVLEREGRVSLARAVGWLEQAGRALRVVHAAGIVHRDIKPSNLFLAKDPTHAPRMDGTSMDGTSMDGPPADGASMDGPSTDGAPPESTQDFGEAILKMLDFGIAKTQGGAHTTSAGLLLGSPAYMSPEQARGNPVDERSDLWSLGAVFYRMLTGSAPFDGASSGDVLVRLCTEDVPPPSTLRADLGPDVDAFFRRALARDPARRFKTVAEFLEGARQLTSTSSAELEPPSVPLGRETPTASLRAPRASFEIESPTREARDATARAAIEPTQASPTPRPARRFPFALWPRSPGLRATAAALLVAGLLGWVWRSARSGAPLPESNEPSAEATRRPDPWESETIASSVDSTRATRVHPASAESRDRHRPPVASPPDSALRPTPPEESAEPNAEPHDPAGTSNGAAPSSKSATTSMTSPSQGSASTKASSTGSSANGPAAGPATNGSSSTTSPISTASARKSSSPARDGSSRSPAPSAPSSAERADPVFGLPLGDTR